MNNLRASCVSKSAHIDTATTSKYRSEDTSLKITSGIKGNQKLVEDHYQIVESEPDAQMIRAMRPDDISISIDKLARFICGWLGG